MIQIHKTTLTVLLVDVKKAQTESFDSDYANINEVKKLKSKIETFGSCVPIQKGKGKSFKISKADLTWSCSTCTFQNSDAILTCSIYFTPWLLKEETEKLIQKMKMDKEVKNTKQNEIDQSLKGFNGFNIYKSTPNKSSTMKHIT